MFSPVVVFESCLHIVGNVIGNILVTLEVLSTMDRAFQIKSYAYIEIFKHVVHDHEESFVFFLLCVFPNNLVKTKKS